MKKISIFFIAVLSAGYALHQTSRITKTLPDGFDQVSNYSVGVMGVLPFFCWLLRLLGFTNEQVTKIATAYLSAFVIFGMGVSWARINDNSDTQEK